MALNHECAGADRKKPNVPEILECPQCGEEIEMWTDETEKKCGNCPYVEKRE